MLKLLLEVYSNFLFSTGNVLSLASHEALLQAREASHHMSTAVLEGLSPSLGSTAFCVTSC